MKQSPWGGSQWGNLPEEEGSSGAEPLNFRLPAYRASLRHMLTEGLVQGCVRATVRFGSGQFKAISDLKCE